MKFLKCCFLSMIIWSGLGVQEGRTASSTDTVEYDEFEFFVWLDDMTPVDSILDYLEDLNAEEIWEDDDIDLAIWRVQGYPFQTNDGETISDINAVIRRSLRKTKIRNATFNSQMNITQPAPAATSTCFSVGDYSRAHGDSSVVRLAILDTGISDLSDNNDGTYNHSLTNYSGYDYIDDDTIPNDLNGHGTHVAGLIHSITHGVTTSGPQIEFDIRKTHDANGKGSLANIVRATMDAIEDDADVINMSFSYSGELNDTLFFPMKLVMEEAEEEGVLVLAAAGNDHIDNDTAQSVTLPASFNDKNIISVTSVTCADSPAPFANFGATSVDIGVLGIDVPGPDLNAGTTLVSGTSQSTAIVSACAALLGTRMEVFDYARVKCLLLSQAEHFVDMADVVSADGVLDMASSLAAFSTYPCMEADNCNQSYSGPEALMAPAAGNMMYETNMDINTNQTLLPASQTTFDAAQGVLLLPGFEAQIGAKLLIKAGGCDP